MDRRTQYENKLEELKNAQVDKIWKPMLEEPWIKIEKKKYNRTELRVVNNIENVKINIF